MMISRREHEIAMAIAQAKLIHSMQSQEYVENGNKDVSDFEFEYDEALNYLEGKYTDNL